MSWRNVLSRRFVIAAGILLLAAGGLKAFTSSMKMVLIKEPIELRQSLARMPDRFGEGGRYKLVRREPRMPKDIEDVLGTEVYISHLYRDTTKELDEPGSVIRLHIPYYTGTIDTVPHVPDRCFVAGGAEPMGKQVMPLQLQSTRIAHDQADGWQALTALGKLVPLPGGTVPTTVVHFAQPSDPSQGYTVGYFFIANHSYTPTPEGVRLKAFNLFDRYAYYCKVEMLPGSGIEDAAGQVRLVPNVADVDETRLIMTEFLSACLPEIMLCLPDWEAANAAESGDAEPSSS